MENGNELAWAAGVKLADGIWLDEPKEGRREGDWIAAFLNKNVL